MLGQFILTFVLSVAHEAGWLAYINGVSKKKLILSLAGNSWILMTGTLSVYFVVYSLINIVAVIIGGLLGTVIFWPLLKRANGGEKS